MLPPNFVYVRDVIPEIFEDIRYAGSHNFMGRPACGYGAARAVLTLPAALALKKAAAHFASKGLRLLIYDAYRPQRAVDDFVLWAQAENDTVGKAEFYPTLEKRELFPRGYIARRSGHSRGSTVDLTLTDEKGVPLDMGGEFDWFSPISAHEYAQLTAAQRENRRLLKTGMEDAGFEAYSEEWWHYRLKNEPYPETYFDFENL